MPSMTTFMEYHGPLVNIDMAMARTSISNAVATTATICTRVEPRAGQGWDGRMTRQNSNPTITKLGAMSQFITHPCHEAQSKTTGMCQSTITALKSTTATIGLTKNEATARNHAVDFDW